MQQIRLVKTDVICYSSGKTRLSAYVQVTKRGAENGLIAASYENLTPAQWKRFHRLAAAVGKQS